ncbi:MAG: 3-deoxy-7-phosphoheptulonate synthase [Christensenellaceae bacterium]|nr:3-deoxy-7-phosphoheptulonate synthase [Christensenellaceae bacterium]
MIIVMKQGAQEDHIHSVMEELVKQGMTVQENKGVHCTVLGVIGDTQKLDEDTLSMREGVDRVMRVQEPFKKSNRKFHEDDTVINVGGVQIGGGTMSVVAGPCSVESHDQIDAIAKAVKEAGAKLIRGGAYKPRTSPYAFQGLEKEGLEMLQEARNLTGMPIVSEIISPRHVEMFEMVVDVIQIGARNMQNFDLLKEVGKTHKPILLKRGLSSTIEEWLMSAEYIMSRGNNNVILCERGIRTFEKYTRNTLDLSAVAAVKQLSHLPVVVDPSHGTGRTYMVEPMAMAAVAAGADGLIIEVHNDPKHALSDGQQSLTPEQFAGVMEKVKKVSEFLGKTC